MRRFFKWAIFVGMVWGSAGGIYGGDVSVGVRDLGEVLKPLAEKYKLPGVVGAIVRGDRVVALGSVGVRKVGNEAPFLAGDTIHLGSDTKAMTAILIGELIDKKAISFETTMGEIFPEMAGKMNGVMAKVTVRELLTHTAGLPHDLDWWAIDRMHVGIMEQRRAAVERALAEGPASAVGKFSYSNVGYVVLGAIVEAKTGKSWEEMMEKEIFGRLGMKSGGFGPPGVVGKVEEPWGHILEKGVVKAVQGDNPPVMGPAGRVHCSMGDWAKFVEEAMRGAQGHPTLVSAGTYKELITPLAKQDYAGGWIAAERDWAGGLALTHAGSNGMWYCNVWIAPKKDFAVLIATNYGSDPVSAAADEGVGVLIDFNGRMGR